MESPLMGAIVLIAAVWLFFAISYEASAHPNSDTISYREQMSNKMEKNVGSTDHSTHPKEKEIDDSSKDEKKPKPIEVSKFNEWIDISEEDEKLLKSGKAVQPRLQEPKKPSSDQNNHHDQNLPNLNHDEENLHDSNPRGSTQIEPADKPKKASSKYNRANNFPYPEDTDKSTRERPKPKRSWTLPAFFRSGSDRP